MTKMRLQSVGLVEGTEAGQLQVGDITRWNFGSLGRIIAIEFSKTGKTIICTMECMDDSGKVSQYERKMRTSRLVNIVGRGNTVLTSEYSFEVIEEVEATETEETETVQENQPLVGRKVLGNWGAAGFDYGVITGVETDSFGTDVIIKYEDLGEGYRTELKSLVVEYDRIDRIGVYLLEEEKTETIDDSEDQTEETFYLIGRKVFNTLETGIYEGQNGTITGSIMETCEIVVTWEDGRIKNYPIENLIDEDDLGDGICLIPIDDTEEQKEEIQSESIQENTQPTSTNSIEASYRLNEEQKGIEIVFPSKPSEDVRNALKAHGFKWSKRGHWYSKQTAERLLFVQSLADEQQETSYNSDQQKSPQTFDNTLPEIDINDIETYTIDQKIQDLEHEANWVFRRNKRDHNKEIQDLFQSYQNEVISVLETTDNDYYIYKLKQALQRFKKNYHQAYTSYLSVKGSNPSIGVTGGSGRNMTRYNKLLDRENKLMFELNDLIDSMKKTISKYENKIYKDKKDAILSQVKQTEDIVTFTTQTKEFTYLNIQDKRRAYVHGEYWICKMYGCFRIFKGEKEIHSLKTTQKLQDAKQYVSYLVQKESLEQAI